MIPTTGPKLSSVITRMEWSTPVRICGARYALSPVSAGKSPGSISGLAPAATASAVCPRTVSANRFDAIGPSVVASSVGFPSFSFDTQSTAFSTKPS